MSDITANIVVSMPSQLFTLARQFKANANGKIYIGQIDTDPTNPANQIPVYLENEDGSHVPVSQPIVVNSAGYPVYNGQISKFVTVEGYSMAVYDAYGAQQFYFPNILKYDPDQLQLRLSQPGPILVDDSRVGVKQPLTGSVIRSQHDKNFDIVSVKDFGAIGDGTLHPLSERYNTLAEAQSVYSFVTSLSDSIDWAALQAACSSGARGVYIPERTRLYLTKKITLPANDFELYGNGPTSVITGNSNIFIEFTPSALSLPDILHYFIVIRNILFISDVNDTAFIYAHSIWNGGGHPPHVVKDCSFIYRGLRQTGILCTGITSMRIDSNTFFQGLVSARDNNTGYAVRVSLGDDINTSVMNLQIVNNSITSVSFGLYVPPRSQASGGRCEGIRLVGNMMGDGQTGVYVDSTIAVSITGNQISDYLRPIFLAGCQVVNITGNSEITGRVQCIAISNGSDSYYTDNVTISGNAIASLSSDCRMVDLINLGVMNSISVSGNVFKGYSDGVSPSNTTYGVALQGNKPITSSVVTGNAFYNVTYGVHFGSAVEAGNFNFRVHGNTYILPAGGAPVAFPERMAPPQYYTHSATATFSATTGQATLSIDVSSAKFRGTPIYAEASLSTVPTARLVYLHDSSTLATLQFSIQGSSIVAGPHRWVVTAVGESEYGF